MLLPSFSLSESPPRRARAALRGVFAVKKKVRGATAFRAERRVLCGDFVEQRRAVGYTAGQ